MLSTSAFRNKVKINFLRIILLQKLQVCTCIIMFFAYSLNGTAYHICQVCIDGIKKWMSVVSGADENAVQPRNLKVLVPLHR